MSANQPGHRAQRRLADPRAWAGDCRSTWTPQGGQGCPARDADTGSPPCRLHACCQLGGSNGLPGVMWAKATVLDSTGPGQQGQLSQEVTCHCPGHEGLRTPLADRCRGWARGAVGSVAPGWAGGGVRGPHESASSHCGLSTHLGASAPRSAVSPTSSLTQAKVLG